MYKHVVKYRHKLQGGSGLSPMKTLEFELDRKLHYDGPGEWKNICARVISSQTGISSSSVCIDDGTLTMKCLGEVKHSHTENASKNLSQDEKDANYASAIAADRERRESKMEERRLKAEQEEREAQRRAERDARDEANRRQRASELRSQGKNFQAFLVQYQNGVIAAVLVLALGIFFLYKSTKMSAEKEDALKIHHDLELIEDSVRIYIENKNFDRALILANKLNHPLNERMEQMEFDAWSGYPKYDEYWAKKKEEYKDIILNKGTLDKVQTEEVKSNTKSEKDEILDEQAPANEIFPSNDSIDDSELLENQ